MSLSAAAADRADRSGSLDVRDRLNDEIGTSTAGGVGLPVGKTTAPAAALTADHAATKDS